MQKSIFEIAFQMKAFEQEGEAYTTLIPALQKMRQDKNLKQLAFAKCFYSSPEDFLIILENMKVQGFIVIEKKPERKCFYLGLWSAKVF